MPGSIGLGTSGTGLTGSISTDANGNVTVTVGPPKADGTPNTTVPPNTVISGKGTVTGPAPGPGGKSGKFQVHFADPYCLQIECKDSCEVILSIFPNCDSSGVAIWTETFPNTTDIWKIVLVAYLKQAAADAQPKPPAKPAVPAPVPKPPDQPGPVKPPPVQPPKKP